MYQAKTNKLQAEIHKSTITLKGLNISQEKTNQVDHTRRYQKPEHILLRAT